MHEIIARIWVKTISDAPIAFLMAVTMALILWYAGSKVYATEQDVQAIQTELKSFGNRSVTQFEILLNRMDLAETLSTIGDQERFVANRERDITQIQLSEDASTTMAAQRISEMESEIEQAMGTIRRAEQRLVELRSDKAALTNKMRAP